MKKPVVLVPACSKQLGAHPFNAVGKKYLDAVADVALCQPLLVPVLGDTPDIDALLDLADGVMLTGSVSNVHPSHFDQPIHNPALPLDPARDAVTLPLIRRAIERGVPLFAICRGFQEMNVAFGGTLHQAVHEVAGFKDHREDKNAPLDVQYGEAHPVNLSGTLRAIVGADRVGVNSVHGQGIGRLADALVAEAHADDGLIEAFRVGAASAFAMGLQWHPEWKAAQNPVSVKIFSAFGNACRQYAAARGRA
ncbi:gamma-glutamyl-gamma-aminobutyrate hydrolase family protein [Niveibacterium sp. 24ML]|uniref:gamma-glutamyl-gamma-aminobutyrate hydrolase family protein n=1 Tax=Niveibacterium sp. 24ML TaxID=2985512 RepID=UPI002271C513|nr:gamma-glutamyl-gamma-aminobutyrate hydrolase family protein [Niveibacterium sp. 24ML]MCX9156415.1 gamma-glutamyl-gamma-aminobutyrate hydrolase family protein [Niveibacterium sp. 24ML]